jgi:CheY-like chemotaxis protein
MNRYGPPSSGAMPEYILVVDDDPDIRQILQDRLESYGYLVETAPDGPTALEKLNLLTPRGVFLDIRMPGMDGIEVLGRIRARHHAVSVVIVTAAGSAQSSIHTAAQACLLKPFDTPQIKQAVERWFEDPLGSEPPR